MTISPLVQPSSSSNRSKQSPLQIILKQYASIWNATQLLEAPDDPAILNPFLTKYRWLSILKGLPTTEVRDWVSFPHNRNYIFKELEVAVDKKYVEKWASTVTLQPCIGSIQQKSMSS